MTKSRRKTANRKTKYEEKPPGRHPGSKAAREVQGEGVAYGRRDQLMPKTMGEGEHVSTVVTS